MEIPTDVFWLYPQTLKGMKWLKPYHNYNSTVTGMRSCGKLTPVVLRHTKKQPSVFLLYAYIVDRASRYKFLLITNLTLFFVYLFISSLYMFRVSQCLSSGDRIVLIHHLVWLVCVSGRLICRPGGRHIKRPLTQTNHTRWCINTIRSPDDEHCDARNM